MRERKPKKLLTIAGSDSSGGAGIQADLKTFTVLGAYGMSVITAVTAQNTTGVRRIEVLSPEMVRQQLKAVLEDIPPDAIKIGMLGKADQVQVIAEALADMAKDVPIILDPVMVATSGATLAQSDTVKEMIRTLFPLCTLLTPNLSEAEVLSGCKVTNREDMQMAAKQILDMGVDAVLVKGGHLTDRADDLLCTKVGAEWFRKPSLAEPNTHGTGCTLSSAIAVYLAEGADLSAAIALGKEFVWQSIRHAIPIGAGRGPLNHLWHFTKE